MDYWPLGGRQRGFTPRTSVSSSITHRCVVFVFTSLFPYSLPFNFCCGCDFIWFGLFYQLCFSLCSYFAHTLLDSTQNKPKLKTHHKSKSSKIWKNKKQNKTKQNKPTQINLKIRHKSNSKSTPKQNPIESRFEKLKSAPNPSWCCCHLCHGFVSKWSLEVCLWSFLVKKGERKKEKWLVKKEGRKKK